MTTPQPDEAGHDNTGWSTWALILWAAFGAVVVLSGLVQVVAMIQTQDGWPWNGPEAGETGLDFAIVTRAATAAGTFIAVAIAGAIAYTRQRTNEHLALLTAQAHQTAGESAGNSGTGSTCR